MVKIMTNSSKIDATSYASKGNGDLCILAIYGTTTCLELIKIVI
jgi:hypothetical protein